jgi:hypothetical protein
MAVRPLPLDTGTIADSVEQMPVLGGVRPTATPIEEAPSLGAVYEAGKRVMRGDRTDAPHVRTYNGYAPIVDALGLDDKDNPGHYEDDDGRFQLVDLVPAPTRSAQEQRLVDLIRTRRAKDPKFLAGVPDTVEGLRGYIIEQDKKQRAAAGETLERAAGISGTLASFAGQAVEAFKDPFNIATLPIGGGGKSVLQILGREALAQGILQTVQLPVIAHNRGEIGEELGAGEAAGLVFGAAAAGGLLGVGSHLGGKYVVGPAYDKTVAKLFDMLPEKAQAAWAAKMKVGDQPIGEFFNGLTSAELVRFSRDLHGGKLTPTEQAAANVLERTQEVGEASPFHAGPTGDAAHEGALEAALNDLIANRTPTEPNPAAGERPPAGSAPAERPRWWQKERGAPAWGRAADPDRPSWSLSSAIDAFKGMVRKAESAGDDAAANPRSSARGRFQFTNDTFKRYYRKLFGGGLSDEQILAKKGDGELQEQLMDHLTRDNAAQLERAGQAVNPGNLYLAHFLGPDGAARVLKADPGTPVASILPAAFLKANPEVLGGKSASEVVAWAHRKMGGSGTSVPAGASPLAPAADDPVVAQLRGEALQLDDAVIGSTPVPGADTVPIYARSFAPSEIAVDAARFQFKGGGDAAGVTDRLRGVESWNPVYGGRVVLWEDEGGKVFLADGHQRHGLASRVEAAGGTVRMDGLVLRAADGVTASDARLIAALKNIAEGTGTSIDAAKVIREAGGDALKHLPPKSALVRDGAALARLSDAAFGAVYNDVLPADFAAVIGHLLPDRPELHEAMVKLLVDTDPANRGQAESIVRQGIAAGMHTEEQIGLFGSEQVTTSLFKERAKVLEKGLARLRKMKLVYKTAATEAEALERVGSTIAKGASEKEAQANAEAVAIVDRLAFSAGSPVAAALNDAAARLAAGGKLGDVVGEFTAAIRGLDLAAAVREAGEAGGDRGAPDGLGRGLDGDEADAGLSPQSGDQGQPSLLELERAADLFGDPDGPAVKDQADSLVHDLRAELDNETYGLTIGDDEADLWDAANRAFDAAIDAEALRRGRELLPADELDGQMQLMDELAGVLREGGDVDKAAAQMVADGRIKLEDKGEPPLIPQEERGGDYAQPSAVVLPPANPLKSADYAGPHIAPKEAKAKLAEWKAEAKRIGKENPPPEGSVILSLFDTSGTWSKPYRDMGYEVYQLDIKQGFDIAEQLPDILRWIEEAKAGGAKIVGVLAQPPCTTFAGSGARWWDTRHNRAWGNAVTKMWGEWAGKNFASPMEYNQFLVHSTETIIGAAEPSFFAIENPRGRIAAMTGLPKPNLVIEPHHFGDPYTKNTSLYGSFNNELPTANVDPVEGSRMHKLRSNAEKDAGLRSLTPEGFAYAFAMANRPGTEARAAAAPSEPVLHGADVADAPAGATKAVTLGELLGGTAGVDPALAARQRQEMALQAASPLRPGAVDAEGTGGLGLFDAADTFRLDFEGGETTAADLLAELDADDAAIAALKACL